jgi:hypothetical protein
VSVGYLTVYEAARWASGRDLASLRVKSPERGQVNLGRHDGRLIAASDRASTLVMDPTQVAGKSSRIVIPALLEGDGPVLTTSIKRGVVDAMLRRGRELGEVKVFDPLGPGLCDRGELRTWWASDQDRACAKPLQHGRERGMTELWLDKAEGLR